MRRQLHSFFGGLVLTGMLIIWLVSTMVVEVLW